ncbi:M20/M25/M40 family metallo-hydrolase [Vaginisenegalia massiliensis]|uniref:M20/M25/M40 family metallo-hydrolase n=1 Tax=Vaginisenegalia massiliensis TaxID=2058294 RepID=UPI000F51D1F4|nr:M20/M25/M40 family metallo-hydrolase [Vaginisenegalia massiliensis]
MLGKNNMSEMTRRMANRKDSYTIKRLGVGVLSVVSGTVLFFGANQVAQAQETTTVAPVVETTTVAETTTAPVAAETTTVAPETTTENTVGNDATLKEMDLNLVEDETFGEEAAEHIEVLSKEIGSRVVGSQGEAAARQYIIDELRSYGYDPELQEFSFTNKKGESFTTSNIIAYKAGQVAREVVVGAHYDSVNKGGSLGADDNASGVGVTLEMARRLMEVDTKYSLKFVFFGAEEMGLQGSKAYVKNMTEEEIANTAAMVNLDSLIAGDKMYIHAGLGGEHWVRDQAFDIADELGIEGMEPNPGKNPEYPYGETGDWSDHAPFNEVGIPIVYFEGTNWDIAELDGYDQTEKYGPIFHTGMDNLDFITKEFGSRAQDHLHAFSADLYNLLINMTAPEDLEEFQAIDAEAAEEEDKVGGEGKVIEKSEDKAKETLPATGEEAVSPVLVAALTTLGFGFIALSKKK